MTRQALKFLTLAAVAALIALMLYAGEPSELWWRLATIPFGVWIIAPSLIPYGWATYVDEPAFDKAMLAIMTLSSAGAGILYYDAFFVSTSSTAALIMIFMPAYQLAFVALTGLLSLGAIRLFQRRQLTR